MHARSRYYLRGVANQLIARSFACLATFHPARNGAHCLINLVAIVILTNLKRLEPCKHTDVEVLIREMHLIASA
jgi:uncharacterized membrane protein